MSIRSQVCLLQTKLSVYRSTGSDQLDKGLEASEAVETQIKPLTLESLPPSPPLRNFDPEVGPISRIKVLCFLTPWDRLREYADKHSIAVGRKGRAEKAWELIRSRLPLECRRSVGVDLPDQVSLAFVVTTNRSRRELEIAKDVDLINRTRVALGPEFGRNPPEWRRVRK